MIIQGNVNNIGSVGLNRNAYPPQPLSAAQASATQSQNKNQAQIQRENLIRRFDSVTISGERGAGNQLQEIKSRLVQEVRTSRPAESIDAIREELRTSGYSFDAQAIAKKMLLLGDAT